MVCVTPAAPVNVVVPLRVMPEAKDMLPVTYEPPTLVNVPVYPVNVKFLMKPPEVTVTTEDPLPAVTFKLHGAAAVPRAAVEKVRVPVVAAPDSTTKGVPVIAVQLAGNDDG